MIVIQLIQQGLDELPPDRMHKLWLYITDGLHHETPFVHAGVRDFKPRGLNDTLAVEDDIQIEPAGTEAYLVTHPPGRPLDGRDVVQQVQGAIVVIRRTAAFTNQSWSR